MRVSLTIARRYFLAKHKTSFINVLSWVSMAGLAVGTAALVIVLSAFNGMQQLIRSMYNIFDADIRVEAAVGKSFTINASQFQKIQNINKNAIIVKVAEDNALALFKDLQMVVKVKGVSDNFTKQRRLQKAIVGGTLTLRKEAAPSAVVGYGIYSNLGISLNNVFEPLQIWYPKNQKFSTISAANAFNKESINVSGVFSIDAEIDEKYVIVPLRFIQELNEDSTKLTSLEIELPRQSNIANYQAAIQKLLGSNFKVLNSDEQHADLLKILKIEKLFVFLALSIILLIASFNIFVALNMLVLDKQQDIRMLHAMGINGVDLRNVFLLEGAIISFIGCGMGMIIGYITCFSQQKWQWLSSGMENSAISSYPIDMRWLDFILIFGVVIFITLVASYNPARKAGKVI